MARLLVVDDDPAIAKFVRRGMEADGHVVSVTSDAPSAVRLVQESQADVAIVDIVMPEIDGKSLLPLLLAVRPDLRVIMLSVDADVTTRVDCFEGGAADFVPKPFSIRELAARVQVQPAARRRLRNPMSCGWVTWRSTASVARSRSGGAASTSPTGSSRCCTTSWRGPAGSARGRS